MSKQSYLIDPPDEIDKKTVVGLLTTCHTCGENKDNTCPDCSPIVYFMSFDGVDPDDAGMAWNLQDIVQERTRSTRSHRWPYQFISKVLNLGCNENCVYLVRIQYDVTTSSARRSFFQTGFSDIWTIERWGDDQEMQEIFCIATSLPFDIRNDYFSDDYLPLTEPGNKIAGSTADKLNYFNPYGLRERYDDKRDNLELHCGTLMFFARGDDVIKIRLAQHTNLHEDVDINPDDLQNSLSAQSTHKDYLATYGNYEAHGNFQIKVFTRPIPGALKLSRKSTPPATVEKTIKYHPKLF